MFTTPWLAGLTLFWLTTLPTAVPEEGTLVAKVFLTIDELTSANGNDVERTPRSLTLNEAITLGLENAAVGLRHLRSLGIHNIDPLADSQETSSPGTDSVNTLSLQLAVPGTNLQAPLTRRCILVTRSCFDQPRAALERNLSFLLLNVETAYWNLYGAFGNLHSSEQALRQAYETLRISQAKFEASEVDLVQFAQARGQYEQFRGDRIAALSGMLEAERTLRHLIGLPGEDGIRLVPSDSPTQEEFVPDWPTAVKETLTLRPELILAQAEVRKRQLEVIRLRNQLSPTLTMVTMYYGSCTVVTWFDDDGILRRDATGATPQSNWLLSVVAKTLNRQAEQRLAQIYGEVRDEENRAVSYLAQQVRTIIEKYAVIQARHAQRLAFAEQVQDRFKEFVVGKTTADFFLEAQRQWAAAMSSEYQEVVNYNNALARFQFAKGTLLQHHNVFILEGK